MSALLAVAFLSLTSTEDVRDLAVLPGGVVAAATSGGVDLFDPAGRPVRTVHVEDGLPSHETWAVAAAGDVLFVATSRGIAILEPPDGKARREGDDRPWQTLPEPLAGEDARAYAGRLAAIGRALVPGEVPAAIAADGDRLAVVAADGRLRTRRLTGPATTVAGLTGRPLAARYEGDDLAIATTEGLFRVDGSGRTRPVGGPWKCPLAARASDGRLVVAEHDGEEHVYEAGRLAPTGRRLPSPPTALSPGTGHVGVLGAGVHDRAGRRLTPRGQLCSNHVTSIARHGERLVAGTFDRGICTSTDGGRTFTRIARPALPSDIVFGVASDGRRLYAGTEAGLAVDAGNGFTHYAFGARNPFGLASLAVAAVLEGAGRDGGVALVDSRGLSLLDASGELAGRIPLPARPGAPAGAARHVTAAAAAGRHLWIGTEDRGVLAHDGERWRTLHDGRDLPDNWVTALDGDEAGRLVVGTCQHGAALIAPGAVPVHLAARDGLGDDMVTAVALAGERAFVGTLGGLSIVDGGRVTATLRAGDGLADDRVASVEVLGEALWIGTEAGLSFARLDALPPAAPVARR